MEEDQKEELNDEEIEETDIKKDQKQEGGRSLQEEKHRLFGNGQIRWELKEMLKNVWREEDFPGGVEKGDNNTKCTKKGETGKRKELYEGVTFPRTAYKIHAALLTEKLRRKLEEKRATTRNANGI